MAAKSETEAKTSKRERGESIHSAPSKNTLIYDAEIDRNSFRLIRILGGDKQSTICCEMFKRPFSQGNASANNPEYVALSYLWGKADYRHVILVDGKVFMVSTNLYSALSSLRQTDPGITIWIDAICINQSNGAEKGQQVQRMAEIYKEASEVIVWLGKDSNTSQIMDFMRRAEDYEREHKDEDSFKKNWQALWSQVKGSEFSNLRQGLRNLLNRPWFDRVWVLQEAAHAKNARVMCGSRSISSEIFVRAPDLANITLKPQHKALLDILPGQLREESWYGKSSADQRSLESLLVKFRRSKATKEVDKIYALLSMTADACDSDRLRPDYTMSTSQVIHATASFILGAKDSELPRDFFPDWTIPEFLEDLLSLRIYAHKRSREMRLEPLAALKGIQVTSEDKIFDKLLAMEVERDDATLGDLDLKSVLLDRRARRHGPFGRGPLVRSVAERDDSKTLALLKSIGPLSGTDFLTLVKEAQKSASKDVLKHLLDRWVDFFDPKHWSTQHCRQVHQAYGIMVRTNNDNQQTPLDIVAACGDTSLLPEVLGWGRPRKAFLIAILLQKTDVATYLLQHMSSSSLHLLDTSGFSCVTPLMLAAKTGKWDIVKQLLERRALPDVSLAWDRHQTILHMAVKANRDDVVRLLFEGGHTADWDGHRKNRPVVDAKTAIRRHATLLEEAVILGNPEMLRLLLENGVDAARQGWGSAALVMASCLGHQDMVRYLLDRGTDIDTIVWPWNLSQYEGYATVSKTDSTLISETETSLMATSTARQTNIVRLLLDRARGDSYESITTPLVAAAATGHTETVRLLLDRGANINIRTTISGTPLVAAAAAGHTEIVQTLLRHGARLDDYVFHKAADAKRWDVAWLLLNGGAIISTDDMVENLIFELVRYILKRLGDVHTERGELAEETMDIYAKELSRNLPSWVSLDELRIFLLQHIKDSAGAAADEVQRWKAKIEDQRDREDYFGLFD